MRVMLQNQKVEMVMARICSMALDLNGNEAAEIAAGTIGMALQRLKDGGDKQLTQTCMTKLLFLVSDFCQDLAKEEFEGIHYNGGENVT